MSQKDAELLGSPVRVAVVENGVDLERFRREPEQPGQRLLFIGSFRHFPNVAAYRFFTERGLAAAARQVPRDDASRWSAAPTTSLTGAPSPIRPSPRPIRASACSVSWPMCGPLYAEANLVIVPTTVSAGTNVKVLEAMAMQRAVVSTTSGCAGLGLLHGHSVWVADTPEAFAAGIATLIADPERREQIAAAAYGHAVRNFDWRAIGEKQRGVLRAILPGSAPTPI